MTKSAIVLGAGIQGVCVALMLQKHGYRVRLIDKSHDVLNRTSLTYEGKLHLGFVYGMDKTRQTGRRMIRDALHFAPCLDYLLGGKEDWSQFRSKPNIYLVAPDSMLSPEEVHAYFEKLDTYFHETCRTDERLHYLGDRPACVFQKTAIPDYVAPGVASAAFLTAEVSVDQWRLKQLLKQRLAAASSIDLLLEHEVQEIRATSNGFAVECRRGDGTATTFESEIVCNCLWEKRIHFDRALGITDEAPQSLRLKYGLIVETDAFLRGLHSLTMIHGPYGNIVVSENNDRTFCSWYPSGMKGLMEYADLPETWEKACDGHASTALIEHLRREHLAAFRKILPGLPDLKVIAVKGGVILAEGSKDISERDSAFHARNDTPVREKAGYYSVNTSKYTSAPRNTLLFERMITPRSPWANGMASTAL
jgi:hypothetical protein